MHKNLKVIALMAAAGILLISGDAFAAQGHPVPWQMWFQDSGSTTEDGIQSLHHLLFAVEVGIVVFVLVLLGYILVRFNSKANPVPAKFTHNTLLEVVWTAVPIVILVIIAVPSLKLLYYADHNTQSEMTLKVKGNQWFWTYSYPDQGDITFDSMRLDDETAKEQGKPRMFDVDEVAVLPVGTNVRILVGTNDVIHNWAIPSLGVRIDATPGRVNETWVNIKAPGDYYGMCSELCGIQHGFMPIHVHAVSKEDFAKWIVTAKKKYASAAPVTVAQLSKEVVGR